MDVKFTQTTAAKLNSLSIVNGQIIALSDQSGLYYDLNGVRRNAGGHYLPLTGGTLNGRLNVGGKIAFWTDNEGGNIDIYSPNGHIWQMDAHNDITFRIYHHNGSTITGMHIWADNNYQSAGDVTTSSGVSLNGVYNNFANYMPITGGTFFRSQYNPAIAVNSDWDETSIYYQKDGVNRWAVGKGVGGIVDDFGFWSFDTSSVAVRISKNGDITNSGSLGTNGNIITNSGLYVNGGYAAIGNRLILSSNGEGGNIRLGSSDGKHHWEIDGCTNERLRIYHGLAGVTEYDKGFYFGSDGRITSESGTFALTTDSVSHATNATRLAYGDINLMLSANSTYHFKPYVYTSGGELDNRVTLGSGGARWKQLFAGTATISTSDRNLKDNIEPLTDIHKQFFMKLLPVSFTFKDGESGRTHIGFIAQDIEDAMNELGLTSSDFAGFCKDVLMKTAYKQVEVEDADGNTITKDIEYEIPDLDENGNVQYRYSLRYEEFIGLIAYTLQDTMKELQYTTQLLKNTNIDARLADIEARLAKANV